MSDRLERLIRLVAKTGDNLIVYDRQRPEESFVIVGLTDYEKLVASDREVQGLTEDELIDKINRDIAVWKGDQSRARETEQNNDFFPEEKPVSVPQAAPAWQPPKVNPAPPVSRKNAWTIPESRRREAE